MSITKETLRAIDDAKTSAITILYGDGHTSNDFYIKDTILLAEAIINVLKKIKEDVDIAMFRDLCELDFEALYMLLKKYEILTPDIENLENFNMRYVHFLNSLKSTIGYKEHANTELISSLNEGVCENKKKVKHRNKYDK